jgi:hypothetical protein
MFILLILVSDMLCLILVSDIFRLLSYCKRRSYGELPKTRVLSAP